MGRSACELGEAHRLEDLDGGSGYLDQLLLLELAEFAVTVSRDTPARLPSSSWLSTMMKRICGWLHSGVRPQLRRIMASLPPAVVERARRRASTKADLYSSERALAACMAASL